MNMKVALSKFRCLKTTFHFIFILSRQHSTDIMKKQPTDHGVTAGLQKLSLYPTTTEIVPGAHTRSSNQKYGQL